MEDWGFWLGLAASVPLSILGNLLTPNFQNFLAKRSSEKSKKRVKELQKEFERIKNMAENPEKLHTYLLMSILLVTFATASLGAISGALFLFSSLLKSPRFLYSAGQLIAISGATVIAKICFDSIRDANRARNLEKYKERLEADIGTLD